MKNIELKELVDILSNAGYEISINDFRYTLTNGNTGVFIADRATCLEHSLNNIRIYKEDSTDKIISYLKEKIVDLRTLESIKNNSIFNEDVVELEQYIKNK